MEGGTSSSAAATAAAAPNRRDPYEVLNVSRDSSDQEIKSAYRKLALKLVQYFVDSYFFIRVDYHLNCCFNFVINIV